MTHAAPTLTTIVVSPRERFESTLDSLKSLYENTEEPFDLVFVDAGSPRDIHKRLLQAANEMDFTLVRCEKHLAPNQARNVGLNFVTSPYVAFVDNDVIFAPGWLTSLVRCAEETGAAIVTPLTCVGRPVHSIIHNAGGRLEIAEEGGKRVYRHTEHESVGRRVDEVQHLLAREPTGECEFHAVLVRSDVFAKHGKLDEHHLSVFDHTDLSLQVRSGGGTVFFEPESIVTYVPQRLRARELPFYMLRWSDKWTKHSQEHFLAKWRAEHGKPHYTHRHFVRQMRGNGMPNMRKRAISWCGWRLGSRIIDLIEATLARLGSVSFAGLDSTPRYRVAHAGGHISEAHRRSGPVRERNGTSPIQVGEAQGVHRATIGE